MADKKNPLPMQTSISVVLVAWCARIGKLVGVSVDEGVFGAGVCGATVGGVGAGVCGAGVCGTSVGAGVVPGIPGIPGIQHCSCNNASCCLNK